MENATLSPGTQARLVELPDKSRRTMITCPLGVDGWYISYILSEKEYQVQRQAYILIILAILFVIVLMGLVLLFLLNCIINAPVDKIRGKVLAISEGDFSRDPSIEWENELGTIGKGINTMAENVVSLMDRKVEDEKQKKDLEYQILQSQINPHFLYNTLNSIKWMATIQNASGIAEMIVALARLLKNVSKGTSAPVPFEDELNLVKDYFLIQQYRYGGSISISSRLGEYTTMTITLPCQWAKKGE